MMAEDNTEFMTTEPLEPPTIMMSAPTMSAPTVSRALTPVPELMIEPTPLVPELIEPTLLITEPQVPTEQVVPLADQVVPLADQVVPTAERVVVKSKVDLLFTALSTNTMILTAVHNIKSRGKLEASDIPVLMLCIYNEYEENKKVLLTIDDLQILIERLYNYLVDKYSLIDPVNQLACFAMFDSALKLLLAVPALKKKCFFLCF